MRVRYNREEDILTLELSGAPIDHAEEAGPLIAHFTADDRLVVLEILEASDFLSICCQDCTPVSLRESLKNSEIRG